MTACGKRTSRDVRCSLRSRLATCALARGSTRPGMKPNGAFGASETLREKRPREATPFSSAAVLAGLFSCFFLFLLFRLFLPSLGLIFHQRSGVWRAFFAGAYSHRDVA